MICKMLKASGQIDVATPPSSKGQLQVPPKPITTDIPTTTMEPISTIKLPMFSAIKNTAAKTTAEQRRLQNRKAQQQSRLRKKAQMDDLERTFALVSRRNASLKQENHDLLRMLALAQAQVSAINEAQRNQTPNEPAGTTPASVVRSVACPAGTTIGNGCLSDRANFSSTTDMNIVQIASVLAHEVPHSRCTVDAKETTLSRPPTTTPAEITTAVPQTTPAPVQPCSTAVNINTCQSAPMAPLMMPGMPVMPTPCMMGPEAIVAMQQAAFLFQTAFFAALSQQMCQGLSPYSYPGCNTTTTATMASTNPQGLPATNPPLPAQTVNPLSPQVNQSN